MKNPTPYLWVLITMHRLALRRSMTRQTEARLTGSMPVVGSSSTISGDPIAAIATERRRFMPPENEPAGTLETYPWKAKAKT